MGKYDDFTNEDMEREIEGYKAEAKQLETQLKWIVSKIKTLKDYHIPTDGRNRDLEIKGWMHVLCSSHESLKRWLKEFKETKAEKNLPCVWSRYDSEYDTGQYETSCDKAFVVLEGTLKDNQMNYCCYCGKPLEEKILVDEEHYE